MTSIEQVFTTKVRDNVYSGNRDRYHRHVFFLKDLRSNVSAETKNPDLGRVEIKIFLCARARLEARQHSKDPIACNTASRPNLVPFRQ